MSISSMIYYDDFRLKMIVCRAILLARFQLRDAKNYSIHEGQ
jgi:hypothetical protein